MSNANDEIVDVLLSKKQLLSALRFVRSNGMENHVSARRFLETAASANDNMLFYTVFRFFVARNVASRRSPHFRADEKCGEFVQMYNELFVKNTESKKK